MSDHTAQILATLEALEAHQINIGLYNTYTSAAALYEALQEQHIEDTSSALTQAEIELALKELVAQGEVIEWQPGSFRSRIAETVRLLRLLRARVWKRNKFQEAPLLVEDVRVEFRQRTRPQRDAVPAANAIPSQLSAHLAQAFHKAIQIPSFSRFQATAIEQVFHCAQQGNPENHSYIIAGDTGAGKTEAFLFPILLDIINEPSHIRTRPGVRAVLVYPRIRLARNQLSRLLRYTSRLTQESGLSITIGIQNGDVPADAGRLKQKWQAKHEQGKRWYNVELIETCVECKNGHYRVAEDDPALETGCPALVCSDCGHTITTLHITQAALQRNAPDILIITDVSLSQWLAREKYTHLWGLWQEVEDPEQTTMPPTLSPRFLVFDEVHLHEQIKGAHIARLIKRFQARVRLVSMKNNEPDQHPIVIGVSATLHDEQRFLAKLLDIAPADERYANLRVIKPRQDELEPTGGRERYIFIYPRRSSPTPNNPEYRVNDQTAAINIVMAGMHNLKAIDAWRGLAFFDSISELRQFYYNYDGEDTSQHGGLGQGVNRLERWRIHTNRKKGRARESIKNHRGSTYDERGKDALRPTEESVENHCGSTCEERAKNATLHECPHFRDGDCWVFAHLHGWNKMLNVAKPVYAGSAADLDGCDLIPSSPSLEVGYDDDAIQIVYQHKAPSNAASFIQRRGRAGRSPADSPIIITLLWPYRRDDVFYFFHPEALYDPVFNDIPLNASNFHIQRTHTLLAFFDLLACLRRQNIEGIAEDEQIVDFTEAGWSYFRPGDTVIQSIQRRDHSSKGQQIIVQHRGTKKDIWFSGKHLSNKHVIDQGSHILVRGWLLLDKGLSDQILRPIWEKIVGSNPDNENIFLAYLALSDIANRPFWIHRSNPFLIPSGASLPQQLLSSFGNPEFHSTGDKIERGNWLKTYRYVDWMLQETDAPTTLMIHYPNPDQHAVEQGDEPEEKMIEVAFGLTEILPGNVSYRLREDNILHWTPIPPDGESTFLYPEEDVTDDAGNVIERQSVIAYLPKASDITSKADSIFGVPRYLDQRFPGLPMITPHRLRAEVFGLPSQIESKTWYFDPQDECSVYVAPGSRAPHGTLQMSRQSSAYASSVIIPFIANSRGRAQRQLQQPLDMLFGAIDGYLTEGNAMLGYTRVFYEMEINIRVQSGKGGSGKSLSQQSWPTIRRNFYPPAPRHDEAGNPVPVLVGYAVETHGISFQVNPELIDQAVEAILQDDQLRLHLRRNFTQYRMASYATEQNIFIHTLLETVQVAIDYWLHAVVPNSYGVPRLIDYNQDHTALLAYVRSYRNIYDTDVSQHEERITEDFIERLNAEIEKAFTDTPEFRDFVVSVLLHSLGSLLKNLIARLGGVSSDALVAYADLPILDQVDRSINPRILIMDTVSGGSGGIAQAFERLDLTDSEGSLWWSLLRDLGRCAIGSGEDLLRLILTQITEEQITEIQASDTPVEQLGELLQVLQIAPLPEGMQRVGRTLFNAIPLGDEPLRPALILRELYDLQMQLERQLPGIVPYAATVRQAVLETARRPDAYPNITKLRHALSRHGDTAANLDYELGVQLIALYDRSCDDGCPVCMSVTSDVEHYRLAPLLNSRRVLKKLRNVLYVQEQVPEGESIADIKDMLLRHGTGRTTSNAGTLNNRLDSSLGIGVIANEGEDGQVQGSSVVVTDPGKAEDFLNSPQGWKDRWNAQRTIETPGGTLVRSRAEYIIATWLEHLQIAYDYEMSLPYRGDDSKTQYIHPDFYLFEHDVYIEYWGRDDPEYIESRRFKEQVYEQRRIVPLNIEKNDVDSDVYREKIRARLYL